jgi:hypothetical protein
MGKAMFIERTSGKLQKLLDKRPANLSMRLQALRQKLEARVDSDTLRDRASANIKKGRSDTHGFTDDERDYYTLTMLLALITAPLISALLH